MKAIVQSVIAGLVIIGVCGIGSVPRAEDRNNDDSVEVATSPRATAEFVDTWYHVPNAIIDRGYFKARLNPFEPRAGEMASLQARLGSHLELTGLRLFARVNTIDFSVDSEEPLARGEWFELCPREIGIRADQTWSSPTNAPTVQQSREVFGTEIHFETELALSAGEYEIEFRIDPTSGRHWLTRPKTIPGWTMFVEARND